MRNQVVLIIGEVFVDTHLDLLYEQEPLVRMGGIFHAARAFSALNIQYVLAYYAPEYLKTDIDFWSLFLHAKGCFELGRINRAPNVMLINDSQEAGRQQYHNILKNQAEFIETGSLEQLIEDMNPTDILLFPGRYNLAKVMKTLENYQGRLHIDMHYDSECLLDGFTGKIDSIILSTSSSLFFVESHGSFSECCKKFQMYNAKRFLLKENRGGSVCCCLSTNEIIEVPSYAARTIHSVGVGDVYDAFFISTCFEDDIHKRMKFSSLCAAKYAETVDFDFFAENVRLIFDHFDELCDLSGIRLSWQDREKKSIYLAAPDFPEVDTKWLDLLDESLKAHHFKPRRPIQENGLATSNMSSNEEIELYYKDLALLNECELLIAILLYQDPGTLVELGMFKQQGKQTIIFDPYHICTNMFVKYTPDYLCHTISEVIDATFQCLGGK